MANNGFVKSDLDVDGSETLLREVVAARFGGQVTVEVKPEWLPAFPGADRVWTVYVPETGIAGEGDALGACAAQDEPRGFTVSFEGGFFVFRHGGISEFERWMWGAVEHSLARRLGAKVYYDANDAYVDVRGYMLRGGYRSYLLRMYKGLTNNLTFEHHLRKMPTHAWDDAALDNLG